MDIYSAEKKYKYMQNNVIEIICYAAEKIR